MKSIKVEAWHTMNDYFGKHNISPALGKTHVHLGSVTFNVPEEWPSVDKIEVLEDVFMIFNWHGEAADPDFNANARKFKSHASMSVGDIAILVYDNTREIWVCESIGWRLIISMEV